MAITRGKMQASRRYGDEVKLSMASFDILARCAICTGHTAEDLLECCVGF